MKICISHLSALEYYCAPRISREAYVERRERLVDAARTSRLAGFGAVTKREAQQLLPGLGVYEQPYHVLRDGKGSRHNNIVRHTAGRDIPASALVRVSKGFLVSSPELVFIQMAGMLDEVRLIKAGYELSATYGFVSDSEDCLEAVYDLPPLTDVIKMGDMLVKTPRRLHISEARSALRYVSAGSASPMETALAMLLCLPTRLGGMGFEVPRMNEEVDVGGETRRIDLFWPGQRVGIEYMGREFHTAADVGKDDRRKNVIQAGGMVLLNARYEDVAAPETFARLAQQLGNLLGRRVRIRNTRYKAANERLRHMLLGNEKPKAKRTG